MIFPGILSNIQLPLLGRAALWLCVPASEAEAIAGDLAEEYFGDRLPRLGFRRARHWYNSQALRSAVPLLMTRWRRGELAGLLLAAIVAILVPLRLADVLWAFIYSQIPLKASLRWAAAMWIVNLLIAISGAAILSYHLGHNLANHLAMYQRTVRSAAMLAILTLACAVISVMVARGHAPAWYVEALLIAVPAVCFARHALLAVTTQRE